MQITKEILDKFFQLSDENQTLLNTASEMLKTVQDQHGKDIAEIERQGQKIKVPENILWTEVFQLGQGYEGEYDSGIKYLKNKYPDVFEAYAKQENKVNELTIFEMANFGFSHKELTVSNLIKLVDALIIYRLEQNKNGGNSFKK